ncbi:MAG: NAD-dependent epimerase/dehydratase family protein [Formosimonas sp.]
MKVLVCGARGFVGSHIVRSLQQAGHTVLRGVSRNAQAGEVAMDFARDTSVEVWLSRLNGVDAVVNAVGILRERRGQPIVPIHSQTPQALFEACAQLGIRRVVQISALGIAHNATPYATSKCAADAHLLALNERGLLDGVVLRPSIVFGLGGASSQLFLKLAQLPVLIVPSIMTRTQVQPIAVAELAEVVRQLLGNEVTGVLACAGEQAVRMSDFIGSLRHQMGKSPDKVLPLPEWLTQLSAKMGDAVPASPWCSDALSLLEHDNVADVAQMTRILGRAPTHFAQLLKGA